MQTTKEGANLLSQNERLNHDQFNAQALKRERKFPLAQEQIKTDFSEIIAENFGANATYVETLLARWQSNPALVDESWRAYFEELIGANGDSVKATEAEPAPAPQTDGNSAAAAAKTPAQRSVPPAVAGGSPRRTEVIPIRGAALKIVENM